MFRAMTTVFLVLLGASVFASQKIEIQSMDEVATQLRSLQQRESNSDILVVFDIDNTLLTSNQNLGGDAWFNWQAGKLSSGDTQDLVASDINGLLAAQGQLYSLGHMHAPEATAAPLMKSLQDQGVSVFLLTSRGTAFENATQRELTNNGFDPSRNSPGLKHGYAGKFAPFDATHPERSCLTAAQVAQWKLSLAPTPVAYLEGVMYGEGQHKGALLKSLLCKLGLAYKTIVFVDDGETNVDRVLAAYDGDATTEVIGLRYGQLDASVQAFTQSNKQDAISGWAQLKAVMSAVLK